MSQIINEALDTGQLFQIFPQYRTYFYYLLFFVLIGVFDKWLYKIPSYYITIALLPVMLFTYLGVFSIKLGYLLFSTLFLLAIACSYKEKNKDKEDKISNIENKETKSE